MNIIREIKHFFQRRKALDEIFDDIRNLDEVLLEKRIEIFNEIATPRFAAIGLKNWNGKYLWFSDFNSEGIKHVVEYNVFKIFGGSFSFGNCYHDIPTISAGDKLINHKTDKSTKIIYHKKFEGWNKSDNENSPINIDKISTVNEEKFRKSLIDVLDSNIPLLKAWFEKNQTREQNISSLLTERKNDKPGFAQRVISSEYILSFLYASQNDFDSADFWIKKHFERKIHDDVQMKIINERLNSKKLSEEF